MKSWKSFKKDLLKNEKVLKEYNKLEPRYQIISQLIETRARKGITQKELAERIGTKQSAIARVESGATNPTIAFLEKISSALDSRLIIQIK